MFDEIAVAGWGIAAWGMVVAAILLVVLIVTQIGGCQIVNFDSDRYDKPEQGRELIPCVDYTLPRCD